MENICRVFLDMIEKWLITIFAQRLQFLGKGRKSDGKAWKSISEISSIRSTLNTMHQVTDKSNNKQNFQNFVYYLLFIIILFSIKGLIKFAKIEIDEPDVKLDGWQNNRHVKVINSLCL